MSLNCSRLVPTVTEAARPSRIQFELHGSLPAEASHRQQKRVAVSLPQRRCVQPKTFSVQLPACFVDRQLCIRRTVFADQSLEVMRRIGGAASTAAFERRLCSGSLGRGDGSAGQKYEQ